MEKIKILVADDHSIFREGLCQLLEGEEDLEVVAKAADGEEAVRLAKELVPDMAIIDVIMPKINDIEAVRQIKEACPTTAILVLSAYNYESYLLASVQAGAAGYLLKDTPLHELLCAIRAVHAGKVVFDLKAAGEMLHYLAPGKGGERRDLEKLHHREMEVLKLAAKGISNKEIAAQMAISERTVQTHMVNIFRKLEVSSRTEAALRALKEGWFILNDLP